MTQNALDSAAFAPMVDSGRSPSMKSLGAMLVLAIMWGLSIPITKLGLETIPPLTLTAMRFLVAVPLLLVLSARQLQVPWRAVPSIVALGVTGIAVGNVAQSFGVQGTSASVGTIVSATIPILVVIFAAIRLRQTVAVRHWIGLLAAFGGIALVAAGSGAGADDLSKTTAAGVVWILVSAVAIAFYFIWSAELSVKFGTLAVTTWNSLAGFIAILPLAAWEMSHIPFQITTQAVWGHPISRRRGVRRGPVAVAPSAADGSGADCGERAISPAGRRHCRRIVPLRRRARPDVHGRRDPDPQRARIGRYQQATCPRGGRGLSRRPSCSPTAPLLPERLGLPSVGRPFLRRSVSSTLQQASGRLAASRIALPG